MSGKKQAKKTKRSPNGSVRILARGEGGNLTLVFPRSWFEGSQRKLSLKSPDTPANRKVAEALASRIEVEYLTGQFDPTLDRYRPKSFEMTEPEKELTLQELWWRYQEARKKSVSPTTYKNTYLTVNSHLQRCPYTNVSKDAVKIQDWAIANLTHDTARRFLQQLGACCKWGNKRQLCEGNPFAGMSSEFKKKKPGEDIDPFEAWEKEAILAAFQGHKRELLIKFLFWTGCRTGEAVGLRWKHISPDFSEIEFVETVVIAHGGTQRKEGTKTGVTRRFPCNQRLKELLKELKPENALPSASVFNCSHQQLRDAWLVVSDLVQKGKIKRYRPQYNTRHTFCTECLERGISPAQIAKWVGNSTEMIVRHYAGIARTYTVPEDL